MRVGTPKFQRTHGFRRGQPVIRANGAYELATTASGYTGLVGSILSADQFELVTSGEIDNVPSLIAAGDMATWYLSSSPGVLATTGTTAVGKVIGQTFLVTGLGQSGGTVTNIVTGVELSDRIPLSVNIDSVSNQGSETEASRADHRHILELPDNIAYVDVDNRFSVQQTIIGVPATTVDDGQTVVGGGDIWTAGRLEVGTDASTEASQFGGSYDGVDVIPDAGKVRIGGGWGGFAEGITVSAGNLVTDPFGGPQKRTSVLFQPRTAWESGGLNFTWCNPPAPYGDGKLIAHVGVNGSTMDFSADGLTGGCQFYTNTGTTTAQACMKLFHTVTVQCPGYDPPSPSSNTIEMGKGSFDAYNWIACGSYLNVGAHGAPASPHYADFTHATRWARFRGAAPSADPASDETLIGSGRVKSWYGYQAGVPGSDWAEMAVGQLTLRSTGNVNQISIMATNPAPGGYFANFACTTGVMRLAGVAPVAFEADVIKMGGGQIWASDDINSDLSMYARGGFASGTTSAGLFFDATFSALSFPGGNYGMLLDEASQTVEIRGSAPSSVASGKVAIGGGRIIAYEKLLIGAAGTNRQLNVAGSGEFSVSGIQTTIWGEGISGGGGIGTNNNYPFGFLVNGSEAGRIDTSRTLIWSGTAPSSVSSGKVAIGGGQIRAAGEVYAYGTDPNNTPLNGVILAGGAVRAYSDIASRTSVSCSDKVRMTPEGGIAIKITNKSGANSIKGRLVQLSGVSQDNAYTIAAADSYAPVGAEYESGVADGSDCWIVVSGIAEVLLKDSTASTRGYWAKVSDDTAGRADITNAVPPGGTISALEDHGSEIGHALESKTAGTSVLCKIVMHFN